MKMFGNKVLSFRYYCKSLKYRLVRYSTASRQGSSVAPGVPYVAYKDDSSSIEKTTLPDSVDAVVIGGGVSGCATLYHLARLGLTSVVLLEKDQLTAGTTWHTAGLLWHLRPSDIDICLVLRAHYCMTTLEDETGVNTGWKTQGGLFVAKTKERLDEYKRFHSLGKAFGIESHVLSAAETKDLYPLMKVDDLYGSVYCPRDGTIDPAGYCTALVRGATNRGAKVVQNCPVTDVSVERDDFGVQKVHMVHTAKGSIKTNCVVNCAGVWARDIGEMAGVKVPIFCMKHAYVVTEGIDGVMSMPNSRDHDASVYLRVLGDTIQIGGYEANPVICDPVSKDFAFSLYDLDWNVFGAHIEGAMNRIPILEQTGIRSTVCGPESFTPDLKPLIGESPEVRGFYLACGHNAGGMMMSGCSEQLAQWIINGRPEIDMFGYDIRRFNPKLTENKKWIKEKSHESYSKHYSIHFPKDEPLAGRNQITDPLYQLLLNSGCVYQERHGWERPGWFADDTNNEPLPYDYYGNYENSLHAEHKYKDKLNYDYTFDFPKHHSIIGKECLACREKVAVFNMSYFGNYYLVGPDAQKTADWLFTNCMHKSSGSIIYTCMLNQHGGTELDLTVSVLSSGSGEAHAPNFKGVGFYLAIGGAASHHAYCYIRDAIHEKGFNCAIIDHSSDLSLLSVQGPFSRDVLQTLTDTDLSNDAFPFSSHQLIQIAGHECRALRISFVGELGWELHVPNTSAVDMYKAVMEAGKEYGIVNAGYRAMDSLSIEKGYRHWHLDLRPDDTPLESGLMYTCKPVNGPVDYIGKSALQIQEREGVKRKLVCFLLKEKTYLDGLETIWRNGEPVGFVRAADYAFYLDKTMAYGYITRTDRAQITSKYIREGHYELERLGEKIAADVFLKSPFDPKNLRTKGSYI